MNMILLIEEVINEVITNISDLHPNVKDSILPVLLTWDEYYNKINPGDKSHGDDTYNFDYDKDAKFTCPSDSTCKVIKNKQVNKILLKYYLIKRRAEYAKFDGNKYIGIFTEDELKKIGKDPYIYSIVCTHDNIYVGSAQDEWGAVLITVVKEYRGLGIGEDLVKMYRKIYPYKSSGGFTSGGYNQIRKYYNSMIKTALANGFYSNLLKRGELTKSRFNEIIGSVNKKYKFTKDNKNKLKDIYKGNNEPIFIINNNSVIIFDSILKDNILDDDIPESFIKDFIYCYAYVTDFNDFPQLYSCYGDEKYIKYAINILATINKNEGGLGDYYFRNMDNNTKKILNDIWNDNNKYIITEYKDKGYISSVPLTVIKPKKDNISIVNNLRLISNIWFRKNDKYGELKDKIHEIAYGYVDN